MRTIESVLRITILFLVACYQSQASGEEIELEWETLETISDSGNASEAELDTPNILRQPGISHGNAQWATLTLTTNGDPALLFRGMWGKTKNESRVLRGDRWVFAEVDKFHTSIPVAPAFVPAIASLSPMFYRSKFEWPSYGLPGHPNSLLRTPEEVVMRIDEASGGDLSKLDLDPAWIDFDSEKYWNELSHEEKVRNAERRMSEVRELYADRAGIQWRSFGDFMVGIRHYDHFDRYRESPLEARAFLRAMAFSDDPLVVFDDQIEDKRCILIEPLYWKVHPLGVSFDGATDTHLVFHRGPLLVFYDLESRKFAYSTLPLHRPYSFMSDLQVVVHLNLIYVWGQTPGTGGNSTAEFLLMKAEFESGELPNQP